MTSRKTFAPDGAGMSRAERRHRARASNVRKPSKRTPDPIAHLDARQRALASQAVEEAGRNVQAGRHEDALKLIEDVLKLAPDHPGALAQKGNLAFVHGLIDSAIEFYQKSIAIEDRAPTVQFNLGAVLITAYRYAEAIGPLKRAIKLNPAGGEAFNALGGANVGLWRFEDAQRALKKALTITKNKKAAFTNLGLAYSGAGQLEQAADCYIQALRHKADPTQIYDGLIPIACLLALSDDPDEQATWETIKERLRKIDPGEPSPGLLDYLIEWHKVDPAADALARAQAALPALDRETATFPAPQVATSSSKDSSLPKRICALLHFGRSATGLLHTLVDGHPQVTTLPGIYFKGFFGSGVWSRIRSSDPEAITGRFMEIYEVLFDARNPKPVPGNPSRMAAGMGLQEGFLNMGPNKDQVLTVDKSAFRVQMREFLAGRERLTQGEFFLMLHRAFESAQGKSEDKELAFYHIHNPSRYELVNFLRHFPDSQIVMNVREPIQNCESWIAKDASEHPEYPVLADKIGIMPFQITRPEFVGRDAFGVKLDDLKLKPEATMRALAARLGIDWAPSLLEPTMQGLKWWGDPGSKTFGLDPFDPGVLERKVGTVFGERDQEILRTLYYPFRVLYGWQKPDENAFRAAMAELIPMLAEPMECEKLLLKTGNLPLERLKQHSSFRHLRKVLGMRFKTLKKHGTYPGMIAPLKVGD